MPSDLRRAWPPSAAAGACGVLTVCLIAAGNPQLPFVEPEGPNPARLSDFGDPPRIRVPAEAEVNKPAKIVIETYGGACIRKGSTTVSYGRGRVDLRPSDIFPPPETICTLLLRINRHDVTLRFERPGLVNLRIHGTRVDHGRREAIVVSRTMRVR